MKPGIPAIALTLIMVSGCATKQYQTDIGTSVASACGQSVDVAIEGAPTVESSAMDCEQMKQSASEGNGGGDLIIQILGYAAGFALGTALF